MPKFFEAPYYTNEELSQMDEKDIVYPFSDEDMVYDSVKRQYVPTEKLLLKHGIDITKRFGTTFLNTPKNPIDELNYISDQIYTFIDKCSGSNIDTLKWIIAKGVKLGMSPYRFRLLFKEILWKQALYYATNDDATKYSSLDFENTKYLNKNAQYNEDRNIDPKVKTNLMDLGLIWEGSYDYLFYCFMSKNNW